MVFSYQYGTLGLNLYLSIYPSFLGLGCFLCRANALNDKTKKAQSFSASFSILGPSSFLFWAQIILLYFKSSILPRNLQLKPNLEIKYSYSNKDQ